MANLRLLLESLGGGLKEHSTVGLGERDDLVGAAVRSNENFGRPIGVRDCHLTVGLVA